MCEIFCNFTWSFPQDGYVLVMFIFLIFYFICYNENMAIRKQGEETDIEGTRGQTVEIYNGDWLALKALTEKWNFKDEVTALRFALAVLTEAEDGTLQIGDTPISPTKELLKDGRK